jgi:hypothetical protein
MCIFKSHSNRRNQVCLQIDTSRKDAGSYLPLETASSRRPIAASTERDQKRRYEFQQEIFITEIIKFHLGVIAWTKWHTGCN